MINQIIKPQKIRNKLIHDINSYHRMHQCYPKELNITLEELACLREELQLLIEEELDTFRGIKLNVLHEEAC